MPILISTSSRLLQAVARVIVEQSYESFPRTKSRALLALSRPSPFSRDRCARTLGPSRGEFRTQQEETACARATWLRNGGKKRSEKEEKKLLDGTWRKYLIGGTVTVHLAVTSGIPLPVCGETLQGSFTFSHRFSKMAHLTSFALSTSSPSLSFRGSPMSKLLPSYNSYLTGPLSIFVRLVNAGQGHGTIDAVTNFAQVFLGSTTLLPMLLSLVPASHTTPFQEFYREIDPTFDYTASVTASTLKSSIRDSYTLLPRPAGSGTSLHLTDRKMFWLDVSRNRVILRFV